jgi:hypothetical protein
MSAYRCYFIDGAGHILGVRPFECDTEPGAAEVARDLLDETGYDTAELWQGASRIETVTRDEAADGQAHRGEFLSWESDDGLGAEERPTSTRRESSACG